MRLPQSAHRILSAFQPISIAGLVGLCLWLPLGARAATPQLVSSPARVDFGTVDMNQSQTELVSLVNSGSSSVTISAISSTNSSFTLSGIKLPVTLPAGAGTTFSATFSPTARGWVYGDILVTSTASNASLVLPISGGGLEFQRLQASPTTVSFGSVPVGTTATVPVTITNPDSVGLAMNGYLYFGSDFTASGPSLPMTLGPKQSVTVNISFTPRATGVAAGSVLIYGATLNIPVNGTGTTASTTTGQLSVSPTSVSFGSVEVGTSTAQASTLKATGGSVTVNSVASSSSQFAIAGVTLPMTIPAGQSVPYQVTYTPTTSGSASATLSFSAAGSTTATTEAASGTGTMPYVTLSWSASSSEVSGYNVYRGAAPGSYTKLNSSVNASTTYTDSTVVPGTTYYYAATSVSTSGQESAYSSPIQVSVP